MVVLLQPAVYRKSKRFDFQVRRGAPGSAGDQHKAAGDKGRHDPMRRVKFSLSLVAVIALLAVVVGVVAGRATSAGAKGGGGGKGGPTPGKTNDVIAKANHPSLLQTMPPGGEQGGNDYRVHVSHLGPAARTGQNT